MFRSVLTLALSVFLLAEASAQTLPVAAAHKNTRATRRAAKKTQRSVRKTARRSVAAWPAPAPAAPVVAAAEPTGWEAYDEAQARQGRDAVYAAPGMNVHIRTGHEMDNYDGTPRKPAVPTQQTTLSPNVR